MNLDKLAAELDIVEGTRAYPYDDKTGRRITVGSVVWGHPTIGRGHNLDAKPLSTPVIDLMFDEDVDAAWAMLVALLPWVARLDEVRQRAMTNLMFNMGPATMATFAPTWAHAERGEWIDVVAHLWASHWPKDVGDGPGGIRDRADRVTAMLLTGQD
jgi:GH24 family phage-related lysozyme (muramidase)